MPRVLLTLLCALALGACASIPDVYTDHDPSVDFSRYHTYSWREQPEGGTALSVQRIVTRIDQQLMAKGWQLVPTDGDVVVAAHVATREKHRVDTFYDAPMWGGWGWYGPYSWWGPTPYTRSRVTSYGVGTLVVDMFDADSKRAIWSGMAEDVIPDTVAERNADIDNAVAKMFQGFPPGSPTY